MITSETFYRAECDREGCDRMLPDDENESGSHWPREDVVKALGEERGQHDETWAVVGEQTYCPRHAPGNVECSACDGRGYFRTEDPRYNIDGDRVRWSFTDCPACAGRGYILSAALGGGDHAE